MTLGTVFKHIIGGLSLAGLSGQIINAWLGLAGHIVEVGTGGALMGQCDPL